MRYRIQMEPMLGATICVVTEVYGTAGRMSSHSKMYVIEEGIGEHGTLVDVLGELQRLIAETTP